MKGKRNQSLCRECVFERAYGADLLIEPVDDGDLQELRGLFLCIPTGERPCSDALFA